MGNNVTSKQTGVAFMYVNGNLTLILNGKSVNVQQTHPNYELVKVALKGGKSDDDILKLLDTRPVVEQISLENVTVTDDIDVIDGVVYYKGKVTHHVVAQRILDHQKNDLPIDGLVLFLEDLFKNPSYKAVNSLYPFLENRNMPITEDGCFLAYKAVGADWFDKHTHTINNCPGVVIPRLERNQVDDSQEEDCSYGYHVGALDYVYAFAGGDDRMIIVKVKPSDVVRVPIEEQKKCRVTFYEIVKEYDGELKQPLYTAEAKPTREPAAVASDAEWLQNFISTNELCALDDTGTRIRMNPKVKRRWIQNLRNRKYKQGTRMLRTANDKFCCLGVLCDLYINSKEGNNIKWDMDEDSQQMGPDIARINGTLPACVREWAGLPANDIKDMDKIIDDLVTMNDIDGKKFYQIAKYIEKNL